MAVDWIGVATGVFAAGLSAWVALRQKRIEAEVQEHMLRLERDLRAEEVLARVDELLEAGRLVSTGGAYPKLRLGRAAA